MTRLNACAYVGQVVHKRMSPRLHAFSYRVFALCLDVDQIDLLAGELRLFSRGRGNLLSFHDADHAAGTGETVGAHARALLRQADLARFGARVELVCYPRLLGHVFNPLSVYFAYDATGRLGAVIYEVSNTLRERRSYVIPVAAARTDGLVVQGCDKKLYVSPFTATEARYGFHVMPPGDDIVIGVNLRERGRPILKTHFRGHRMELSDRTIALLLLRFPLMTFKVVAAIHLEALRLWLKGTPVQPYHPSPRYSFTIVETLSGKSENA